MWASGRRMTCKTILAEVLTLPSYSLTACWGFMTLGRAAPADIQAAFPTLPMGCSRALGFLLAHMCSHFTSKWEGRGMSHLAWDWQPFRATNGRSSRCAPAKAAGWRLRRRMAPLLLTRWVTFAPGRASVPAHRAGRCALVTFICGVPMAAWRELLDCNSGNSRL